MRTLLQDIRFGLRVLRSHPAFSLVAALTLALGIASTTTVFSWIDSTVLRPFHGVASPDDLAVLESVTKGAPNGGTAVSWLDFVDYRDNLKQISGITIQRQCAFTIGDTAAARLAWGEVVSGNYFDVFGIKPALGRMFTADEQSDKPAAHPVVVISDRLWKGRFRSDPAIAGKTLRVNRREMTIVGVAPPEFHGSVSVMLFDLWIPITMGAELGNFPPETFRDRDDRMFNAVVRLKPGISIQQANAEASTFAASLKATHPKTNRTISATILGAWEQHDGIHEYLSAPLRILMAASLVVLLIVCTNVANLLLARSVARQREFGIRLALGAGRLRIARQLLTESLLLASAGAVIAYPLMLWMAGSLLALVPSVGLPIATVVNYDSRIFGFTVVICFVAALISGAAPALFSLRADVNETLKEGGRTGTVSVASGRTRSLFVIIEVALATVALVGAGLFVKSFRNARAINPGFDSANVLFARFFIESAAYSGDQIQQFSLRLRQRLETEPGIESAGYTDFVPLSTTGGPYDGVQVDGYVPAVGESTNVNRALVTPGYLSLLHIPLLRGRDFTEQDDPKAQPVMIVNESFARRYFKGEDPVGRRVRALGKWFNVVGLAHDGKYFHPAESPRPFFYLPFRQFYSGSPELYFLIRTNRDPLDAISTLRRAVAEVDPNAMAFHPVPFAEYTQVAIFGQKIAASLMGALGLICLLLAALGLYSLMSYAISQRTQEIGIRMAMGAMPGDVVGMVVREGMVLALSGLVSGTIVAFAITRFIASMLIKVDVADPATFFSVAAFLSLVALLATWLPARRATRIDPMLALRRQ